jgi:hypothetical protein
MRYRYYDLGEQEAGSAVTVRLRGSVCNVILLDRLNLGRYRAGEPFLYVGGHYRRSPVRLEIPDTDHWYVVLDLGGYKGRVRATIEVEPVDGSRAPAPSRSLVLT